MLKSAFNFLKTQGASVGAMVLRSGYKMRCRLKQWRGEGRLNPESLNLLKKEFQDAWHQTGQRHQADPDAWSQTFVHLLERHSEPWRSYHNLDHIRDCLAWLESLSLSQSEHDILCLSIWFHDAIYDPWRHDNEQRSAALAKSLLGKAGFENETTQRIWALILMTKSHSQRPDDPLANLFLDIDLAILSTEPKVFEAYEKAIRAEYSFVPKSIFNHHRGRFLRQALESQIYHSQAFVSREGMAKANLKRSLQAMAHRMS